MSFPLWEAAIAAGATLDELQKLGRGHYTNTFEAKLIAWHQKHKIVRMHEQDAVSRANRKRKK